MSAQKPSRGGVFSALAGLVGFSALAGLLVTVMITPALAVTGITASSTIGIFDSLPEYLEIGRQPERNVIYAHSSAPGNVDGYIPIATIYDQNRQEVPLDQISQFAIDAAIDGEDERFFTHGGVDVQSVIRAAVGNIAADDIESGSSTLTMQLVKNIYVQKALEEPTEAKRDAAFDAATAPDFDRKLKEMKLAIGLEKRYTKNEILNAYLNIAFFGDNTYGIQAAAQRYYSVSAKDLTLAQAASLIAIVQYPGERGLDLPENYERNEARRDVILDSMLRLGDITQAEYDEAIAITVSDESLLPSEPQSGCLGANHYAKWWCDYITKNITNYPQLGATEEERAENWKIGGYQLYTTLDMDIQENAQIQTWTWVPNDDAATGINLGSTTVSIQPNTGKILIMTENKEFDDTLEGGGPKTTAVNYATGADYGGGTGFQSGSTYKLFTLLAWLDSGRGLGERVLGTGRTENQAKFRDTCQYAEPVGGPWGGPYQFKNDSGGGGIVDVNSATAGSVNGAFVSMALQLDLCAIRDMAAKLGVERGDGYDLFTNPSSVLGTNEVTPLSMANAYATIAANGLYCKPISLEKAVGPDGTDLGGEAIDCHQAVNPEVAATAAYALAGVMSGGTGGASNPDDGIPIIGKTGTTDDSVDTWIITATTQVATAVWVGNWINKQSMSNWSSQGVGGRVVRHEIMRNTLAVINAKYSGAAFPPPADRLLTGSGINIPDLTGQTPESAKGLLEGLGFVYAEGGQVDSPQPAGRIAGTDPAAGSPGAAGMTVTVYLSKGNQIQIPDAVSGANSYNDSRSILNSAGFNNVSQGCAVVTNPTEVGQPQSQNPGAGAYGTPNTPIRVNIGALSC